MSLTYTDSMVTAHDAAAARRKSVTIGLVIVLHAVMFYGFTHGMKIKSPLAYSNVTLVDVATPPVVEPRPKPSESPMPTDQVVVDFPIPDQMPVVDVLQQQAELAPHYEGTPPVTDREPDVHGSGPQVESSSASITVAWRVDPAYPAAARRAGEQGTVLVSVMVDPNGHVSAASVIQSSGSMALDDAAIEAVRRWLFAVHGGGTVQVRVPISFKLQTVRF
jgi:periplasmic protein TonB